MPYFYPLGVLIYLFYLKKMVIDRDAGYIVFFPIFWAVAHSNASPGFGELWIFHDLFTIFPTFPEPLNNYLDEAIYLSFFLVALRQRRWKGMENETRRMTLCIAAFSVLLLASTFLNGIPVSGGVTVMISTVKSFLLLIGMTNMKLASPPERVVKQVEKGLVIVGVVTLCSSLIQKYLLGGGIDDNPGILGSNSTASFFLMTISFYYLQIYLQDRRTASLGRALLFFVGGLIPSTNRTQFIYGLALLGSLVFLYRMKVWKRIAIVAFVVPILLYGGYQLMLWFDPIAMERLAVYAADLESVGLLKAYMQLPEVFETFPQWSLLGLGPGMFGNPVTFYRAIYEGSGSEAFYSFIVKDPSDFIAHADIGYAPGAFDTINAVPVYLLVENGIIGFVLLCIVVGLVFKLLLDAERRNRIFDIRARAIRGTMLFLVLSLFVNFQGTVESQLYFQPMFILAALIARPGQDEKDVGLIV